MTKSDLIAALSAKSDNNLQVAEIVVSTIFDGMSEELSSGGRIEIRGFGSFENRSYEGRRGRNPKTGLIVDVPPRTRPFFKVGKELRERLLDV